MCGDGGILFVNNSPYFSLKYGAIQGTNNKAKFYALWNLLKRDTDKEIGKLQVMGDSKLLESSKSSYR
jgi:ribonuclease HI